MPRFTAYFLFALAAASAAGCGAEPPAAAALKPAPAVELATEFRPDQCGELTGCVTWVGDLSSVERVRETRPKADGSGSESFDVPHPYTPQVDRFTRAVRGAVVWLKGVEPRGARPWDHPPAAVDIIGAQIVIAQGDRCGRVGFVRPGGAVAFRACEPTFQALRGRGAAFFSLPFPDPDRAIERTFHAPGRVRLTSAAGYWWHAADLFVCEHPYYAVTDADGRFRFAQVPEGGYELVAWHPSWVVTARERNPETGLVQRVDYADPLDTSRPVQVNAGRMTLANLTLPR